MADVSRYNGSPAAGSFYGYQFVVIKVANSNNVFTADSGGSGTAITEGGYSKAVKALAQIGSLIVLGTQAAGTFTAIVDAATVNNGAGATTSGAYGALKDAMVSQIGGSASDYVVTTSSALNGAGTFTFA